MILLEQRAFAVEPVIVRPPCYGSGSRQDCPACALRRSGGCLSTMGVCRAPYPGHPKGCPNYGKKDDCPPGMPLFHEVFDLDQPVFCILSRFDLREHAERMKAQHPGWSDRQCRCCLYWQSGARKVQRQYAAAVLRNMAPPGYAATDSPEAMAVDVTRTLANHGFSLEWPCETSVCKVHFAGALLPGVRQHGVVCGRAVLVTDGFITVKRVY